MAVNGCVASYAGCAAKKRKSFRTGLTERKKFRTPGLMDLEPFLSRCDRWCTTRRLSRARLSTLLFGSGATLSRICAGGGITVRVLSRAEDRLTALERAAVEEAA